MRTSESQYEQLKIKCLKKALQEVCGKFNGAEQYIKERIEEACSEGKVSAQEITYLFMNDYDN